MPVLDHILPRFTTGKIAFVFPKLSLFGAGAGITFGNVILYGPDDSALPHEAQHVIQYGSFGSRGFPDQYFDETKRFGYFDGPFEREGCAAGAASRKGQ